MRYVVAWNFTSIGIVALDDAEWAVYRLTGKLNEAKLTEKSGYQWVWRKNMINGFKDVTTFFEEAKRKCKELNDQELATMETSDA